MKVEAWFSLIAAWGFTLCIPLSYWLGGWSINKAMGGSTMMAVAFWFGYFHARDLDRKIIEQQRQNKKKRE